MEAAPVVPSVEKMGSAEELIEWLRPNEPRWAPEPTDWIFRGQRNSRWELLPTAFRVWAWNPFTEPRALPFDLRLTVEREFRVLLSFWEGLDRSGLDVPNELLIPNYFSDGPYRMFEFPLHPALVTFLALAQHHGIPTRLLDWTRVGLNAAYFAAAGAARQRKEGDRDREQPECLSVWALRADFGMWCQDCLGTNTRRLEVVTAPRASNPNLHAQSGIFTQSSELDPIERTVADLLVALEAANHPFDIPDPLVRFDLPSSESPKLLRLLANEQIDGARMFPGRDGVVMAMKERCLWDR